MLECAVTEHTIERVNRVYAWGGMGNADGMSQCRVTCVAKHHMYNYRQRKSQNYTYCEYLKYTGDGGGAGGGGKTAQNPKKTRARGGGGAAGVAATSTSYNCSGLRLASESKGLWSASRGPAPPRDPRLTRQRVFVRYNVNSSQISTTP